jgi:hypothetical protein
MAVEVRNRWRGTVEVYVDGAKVASVVADLAEKAYFGRGSEHPEGYIRWSGTLGLSEADQSRFVGLPLELRLSNGRRANAYLDRGTSVVGVGPAPF